MKKINKILGILLCVVISIVFLVGCMDRHSKECPEPSATYTEEEQVERIIKRTQEKFAAEIRKGKLRDIHAEIVYSFDNKPEFFLVQLEYKYTYAKPIPSDYAYIIGYMRYEKLRTGLAEYGDFIEGRNPYLLAGYENAKKYYGGQVHAIENNGQMIQIFEMGWNEGVEYNSSPECWEKKVIDPSRFEDLAESNYTIFPTDY